jgi:Protein of unknown function (DUF4238)
MAGKKQHYVPQFLLRNFSLSDSKQKQVAAYRIPEGKLIPRATIRDQAHENHFYGVAEIEDGLAWLEQAAAPLIDVAIAKEQIPRPGTTDWLTLLTFAIAQKARTRAAADETNDFTDKLVKRMMEGVPEFKEYMDQIRITVDNAPGSTLAVTLTNLTLVRDLAYKLLCNRTSIPFLVSDNPAVLYNQFLEHRKKVGSNTGLATKGLQLFLPLDPRHILIFFDDAVYKIGGRRLSSQRVDVTVEDDVRALNLLQAVSADCFLYFNDQLPSAAVTDLVRTATRFRPQDRAQLLECQPLSGNAVKDSILLRVFGEDVRTHLALRFISVTPQARRYNFGNRLVHQRDPALVEMHKRFLVEVEAGRFQPHEFVAFVDSLDGWSR